jgi:excisionase family DNA binding protein
MSDEMELRFYTIEALAKRWQLSKRTIIRQIENGRLRAIRVGKQLRIHPDVVARYEERHQTRPLSGRPVS